MRAAFRVFFHAHGKSYCKDQVFLIKPERSQSHQFLFFTYTNECFRLSVVEKKVLCTDRTLVSCVQKCDKSNMLSARVLTAAQVL